MTTTKTDTVKT